MPADAASAPKLPLNSAASFSSRAVFPPPCRAGHETRFFLKQAAGLQVTSCDLIPEKATVRQARAQHARIAGNDGCALIGRLDIGNG